MNKKTHTELEKALCTTLESFNKHYKDDPSKAEHDLKLAAYMSKLVMEDDKKKSDDSRNARHLEIESKKMELETERLKLERERFEAEKGYKAEELKLRKDELTVARTRLVDETLDRRANMKVNMIGHIVTITMGILTSLIPVLILKKEIDKGYALEYIDMGATPSTCRDLMHKIKVG